MNEEIYKLVIENGWYAKPDSAVIMTGAFVLELGFWQALGKALGSKCPNEGHKAEYCGYAWKFYAHQYFDLVLTNGDTEAFWKGFIK